MRLRWKYRNPHTMVCKMGSDRIMIQTFPTHHTIDITRKDGSSAFSQTCGPCSLKNLQRSAAHQQRIYYAIMRAHRPDLYP